MLRANLFHSDGYQGEDLDKLNRSLLVLESTISGDRFKSAILQFDSFQFVRYRCIWRQKIRTISLQQYTNEEVYHLIMNGHHKQNDDTFMDLKLVLSNAGGGSAIGRTDSANVTTTYRSAFTRMREGELAAHLCHEWTHTLGFEHSFSDSCDPIRNCLSVPYAAGNIIEIITTGKCWYGCRYESLNK